MPGSCYKSASLLLLLVAVLSQSSAQQPQLPITPDQPSNANYNDPIRREAMRLFDQHRMSEAVPMLERVVEKFPGDMVAHERLGAALVSRADTQTDPERKRADRRQARAELLRAKELGDNSDLCNFLLAALPEDGSDVPFSDNKDVDAAMQRGEAAFADGKYEDAISEYSRALELNPKLYLAAVDIGDSYFRLKQMDKAGEWFARAIEINPNQETAYRYWGDALMAQGKMKESRSKFIEGLVANPYTQSSWAGLNGWLRKNRQAYNKLNIQTPQPPAPAANGGTNITIDPSTLGKNNGGEAWITYPMERALWRNEKFVKEFPRAKSYRHSLKEEVSALSVVASVFDENKKKGKIKNPDPALILLSQIKADGFLEPYVLLVRPDEGIAQDYMVYQAANRDKLIQFVDKYVLPPMP